MVFVELLSIDLLLTVLVNALEGLVMLLKVVDHLSEELVVVDSFVQVVVVGDLLFVAVHACVNISMFVLRDTQHHFVVRKCLIFAPRQLNLHSLDSLYQLIYFLLVHFRVFSQAGNHLVYHGHDLWQTHGVRLLLPALLHLYHQRFWLLDKLIVFFSFFVSCFVYLGHAFADTELGYLFLRQLEDFHVVKAKVVLEVFEFAVSVHFVKGA